MKENPQKQKHIWKSVSKAEVNDNTVMASIGTSLTGALWTYLDNSDKTWVCRYLEIANI